MTDSVAAAAIAAAPAPADGGTANGGDAAAAAAAAAGTAAAPPAWLQAMPTELQADPTLIRYDSPEALARAHLEAHRLAKAKAGVAHDAVFEGWDAFSASRPPEASAYQIDVPDGQPTDFADAFRAKAHEIGLHPKQAAEIAAFNNAFVEQQQAKFKADGEADVQAWRAELVQQGKNPDEVLGSISGLFEKFGIAPELVGASATDIEAKLGSKATLSLFAQMAAAFGEQKRIDPDNPGVLDFGAMAPDQARRVLDTKMQNPEWVKQANTIGTNENREYEAMKRSIAASGKK